MKHAFEYIESNYTRTIEPNASFILIANKIDGSINFDMQEFANFSVLKKCLKEALISLKGYGEWDVKLYQIKKPYKLRNRYGYYRYPDRGKLLFTHSYMFEPIKNVIFRKNKITFIGTTFSEMQDWQEPYDKKFKHCLYLEIRSLELKRKFQT